MADKPKPTCTHCGTTRQVFELLGVYQCWTCYCARTAVKLVTGTAGVSVSDSPSFQPPGTAASGSPE